MHYQIDLQIACAATALPEQTMIEHWVKQTLKQYIDQAELCIRIVDEHEMMVLNGRYRNKPQPTNVLAFQAELSTTVFSEQPLLGDLVICAPLVAQEAQAQHKSMEAHWAHLIIHGLLHLLGYDHLNTVDAHHMEQQEILSLATLGYPNPYLTEKQND